MRYLTESFYEKFRLPEDDTIPEEGLIERYGRSKAIHLACTANSESCLTDTQTLVHLYASEGKAIPNGLETTILCSGMRRATETDWTSIFRMLQRSEDSAERSLFIDSLGCSEDLNLLKTYLDSTLNTNFIYSQTERRDIFDAILASASGLEAILQFLQANELDSLRRLGYSDAEVLISNLAQTIKTTTEQSTLIDYMSFFDSLSDDAIGRIANIVTVNLESQQQDKYASLMNLILAANSGWDGETTTVETTTIETTQPITETSTAPVTSPEITSTLEVTSVATTATAEQTTQSVETTVTESGTSTESSSSTAEVTQPLTSSVAQETTTDGSTSVALNLTTLALTLFIAFFAQF